MLFAVYGCFTFLVPPAAMEFALVWWTAENTCGVIPTKWVLEPEKLSPSILPCAGVCRWTSSKQTYIPTYFAYTVYL